MPGICFYFENNDADVYSGRRQDLDAWNYAIQSGGPDMNKMVVLNRTDQKIITPNEKLSFECKQNQEGEITNLPGKTAYLLVGGNENVTQELWDFNHDVDWYFFGPSQRFYLEMKEGDVGITVPMPIQIHALHVAYVVMAHRYAVKHKGTKWLSH